MIWHEKVWEMTVCHKSELLLIKKHEAKTKQNGEVDPFVVTLGKSWLP